MSRQATIENNISIENVISTAIQIPGVKVNREFFLREQFKNEPKEQLEKIIELGPIVASCDRRTLRQRATKLINERTIVSTSASFMAGLPGGLAMTATIPADMLQFYGVALRMAQELAYLYGEQDLNKGEFFENDKLTNQLMLYLGVMLGATGASQAVRVMSSAMAKQILKKLPQKALTKTFYYPIVKTISKFFGISMTKGLFAKGVSKAVPIIGGIISGGITFLTLRPMGHRLADTLDDAHFSYSEQEFQEDWQDIVDIIEDESGVKPKKVSATTAVTSTVVDEIAKAKELFDAGVLTEKEFSDLKAKLIAKL